MISRLRRVLGAAVVCVLLPMGGAAASGFSGVVTLTSEYIYRGLSMSDGNPALQLGLDYEHDSGLFAGAWASTLNLTTAVGRRDLELDFYAGYHLAPDARWSATATLLRYTYPDASGSHSYDHNEILLGLTVFDHYSLEFGYTNDLYGLDVVGKHWEARTEWPIANVWVLSGALGGNDLSDLGVPHYLHWDIGASARVQRFTLDLRWYDNEPPDAGLISALSAGSQLVLSVSVAF